MAEDNKVVMELREDKEKYILSIGVLDEFSQLTKTEITLSKIMPVNKTGHGCQLVASLSKFVSSVQNIIIENKFKRLKKETPDGSKTN